MRQQLAVFAALVSLSTASCVCGGPPAAKTDGGSLTESSRTQAVSGSVQAQSPHYRITTATGAANTPGAEQTSPHYRLQGTDR